MEKSKFFEREINLIQSEDYRMFVKYYLDNPNAPGKENFIKMLEGSTNPDYIRWYKRLNS